MGPELKEVKIKFVSPSSESAASALLRRRKTRDPRRRVSFAQYALLNYVEDSLAEDPEWFQAPFQNISLNKMNEMIESYNFQGKEWWGRLFILPSLMKGKNVVSEKWVERFKMK